MVSMGWRRGFSMTMALLILMGGLLPQLAWGARPAGAATGAELATYSTEPYYFEQSGHYLSGRFRQYWEARGGLYVFGYPLTKVYYERSTDGRQYLTQYFERARFEYHPENQAPYDVLLTLVGNEVTVTRRNEQPFLRAQPIPGQGYAEQTGHNVGGAFQYFWEKYGGLQNFGHPISEEFREINSVDGKEYTVQYFERGRWELHPEYEGSDYVVLLGLMGLERMNRVGVPQAERARETSPPVVAEIPGSIAGGIPGSGLSSTGYPFLKGQHVGLGIQAHWYGQPHDKLIGAMNDVGFAWTKQQVRWKDVEYAKGQYAWGDLDRIMDNLSRARINVLLSVVKSPDWATPGGAGSDDNGTPRDPQDLADFMQALTLRYKGKVHAIEVWNEQNLAAETHTRIDASHYVRMLKASYLAVKAVDPNIIVVTGAVSPTGINDRNLAVDDTIFLEQMFQYNNAEIRNYYDALGSHPYGMSNPPETLASEGKYGPEKKYYEHDSFYFRRVEAHYRIMQQYGDGHKQVWLTEWGYGSDYRPDGYSEFNTVTEEMRADYVVRAITMSRERYPWMGVTFLWNLNWSVVDAWYAGPAHYSIINSDYSPRPVYHALKALPK